MKQLELTKQELLVERLVDELKELYSFEEPLPDMAEAKTIEDLQAYIDMVDLLASKIDYNRYMFEYMELNRTNEDKFDEFFQDLVFSEVI
ncbi:hypothetical protein [Peptoniphilus harei]|uniref:Uncharacterized protein n=1 Tax=Peptoniphilus harei TaxID=54005 RepID=A0A943SPI2_9FIRM|nr:hypothetical protein [Peptoniphilus harei]MBS6535868.1 hypothetical protein [Peptoniphilus harei]